MITISIVEDNSDIAQMYTTFFKNCEGIKLNSVMDSVEEFLQISKNDCADVVLLDIGLPGMDGVKGCALIKERCPESEIIMVTVHQSVDYIFQALRNGASGYVLKDIDLQELKRVIHIIASGGSFMSPSIARKVINFFAQRPDETSNSQLTNREMTIVELLKDGLSYKMIASDLNISMDTVRTHIKHIYKKLQVHSRAEVVRKTYLE